MSEKRPIRLFERVEDCCGCGACANACPHDAIEMRPGEGGFVFPHIDESRCVGCGLCQRSCGFQRPLRHERPKSVFAASARDDAALKKSASGGLFAALARRALVAGGVVYGCAWAEDGKLLKPAHLRVDSADGLIRLQGSKYVQSDTADAYRRAREDLKQGRQVLFSGTPCQISSLNAFLGREWPNLTTVDIICHGVPSAALLRGYFEQLQGGRKAGLNDFRFRDKGYGWGLRGRAQWKDGRSRPIPVSTSSYYQMFLRAQTYRDSCYHCPFAGAERAGDLTLGDYWGIEKAHPEALTSGGGSLDPEKGISCALVNTEKGEAALMACEASLHLFPSDFENVSRENGQLRAPSVPGPDRQAILRRFDEAGYAAVERDFLKNLGAKRHLVNAFSRLPAGLQKKLKRFLGR